MGFLRKSIDDRQWLETVSPWYQEALLLTTALSKAVESGSDEAQVGAVQAVLERLPVLAVAIRATSSPISPEARQARQDLDSALKDYISGAEFGRKLFRVFFGETRGLAGRMEAARLLGKESFFGSL
jgi:hypothetical protein